MSEEVKQPKEGEEGFTPSPKPLMERMREFQEYEAGKGTPTEEQPSDELVDDTPPHTSLDEIKESLKSYLYDESIVDDYAEFFLSVTNKESLDKIIEILAFKESEIVRLTKHESAFKSQSNPDDKQAPKKKYEPEIDPVDAILAQRYK